MPCLFILTRGPRKGQICDNKSKSDEIPYCKDHCRNNTVKEELKTKGIDLNAPKNDKVKPVDPGYYSVNKKSDNNNTESAFLTAFNTKVSDDLIDDTPADMDKVYDTMEDDFEDEEEFVDDKKKPEPVFVARQYEDRRRASMYTMKTLAFTGLSVLCDIAESLADPNLKDYKHNVLSNEGINQCLDEMTADLDELTGLSEQSASVRLLVNLGAIASITYMANSAGVRMKEPDIPPQPIPIKEIPGSDKYDPEFTE